MTEDDLKRSGLMVCRHCQGVTPRRNAMQKYCEPCSILKHKERNRNWARENKPADEKRLELNAAKNKRQRKKGEESRKTGEEISRRVQLGAEWHEQTGEPQLLWHVRASVPFTYAASKNHIYTIRSADGHVAMRRESKQLQLHLAGELRIAVGDRRPVQNKLWIDILVQKPNHLGDAVNVVDLVCDAVKMAVPVDDRWYCIRRLDWQISKIGPMLYVGIGQVAAEDARVCSYCGRILPLTCFQRDREDKLGRGRECKECLAV